MSAWPHRLLFAVAFVFWVLSLAVGIEWLGLAAAAWLPAQFRWGAFLQARSAARLAAFRAERAEFERLLWGVWRARRVEVAVTPDWM
jgi:hypothetical protein